MVERSGFDECNLSEKIRWIAAVALLACLFLAGIAQAQTTATITGTVTDSTGAVVPKAKITLKNPASGDVRESVSNGVGRFSFASVVPGSYDLTVNAPGFKVWETKGLQVHPGDAL